MNDWREKHFGVGESPKILRPPAEPERSGSGFWFFLFLLIATPIAAVAIGYHLGYIGMPGQIVVVNELRPALTPPQQEQQPRVNITYEAKIKEPEPVGRFITQARANELKRLITSRNNGIDLMARERAQTMNKEQAGQAALRAAKERLVYLEKNRPRASDTGAVYQWSLAHDDAVAAGKNATNLIAAQQRLIDSFNDRITKAKAEHDAARDEINGATIIP